MARDLKFLGSSDFWMAHQAKFTLILMRQPRPLVAAMEAAGTVKARAGSWQVLHATVPSADKRPSKNNFSPRAIFSWVCGLSGGIAWRVISAGTPTWSSGLGRANGPASGIGGALGLTCRAASCGAVSVSERARATSNPKRSAAPGAATRNPTHNRACVAVVI